MMWTLRTPRSSVSRQAWTLGIMPDSIAPAAIISPGLVGGERVDQRLGVVLVAAHAVDVAEEDQLLGLQRLGDGRGGRVGVDVELLAVLGQAHRGDHRHDALLAQALDRGSVHPGHRADVAQVDRLAVRRPASSSRSPNSTLVVRKFSGRAWPPSSSIRCGQPLVDLVGQHPLDDRQRGVVGVAAALDEARLEPGRRPWPG